MTKQEAIELSKPFFKAYTKAEEFFLTVDKQVFKNLAFATNHIEQALNKQIIKITREEAELEQGPTPTLPEGKGEALTQPLPKEEEHPALAANEDKETEGTIGTKVKDKKPNDKK